ncbi:MAG: transposase [Tepidisphaeraceae bacterium]|jgi:REP-associated tyrosine transposase
MLRTARNAPGGLVYHVLNRSNARRRLFHKDADYEAFLELLGEAVERMPMRVLAFCLMPNHWHLVLWPSQDGELSLFMRWLSNTHVRRYHQHYHSYGEGHVYQGRFKSFPIQDDGHLLTVLRYVEANPLRAKLVSRAQDWPWSSLSCRRSPKKKVKLLSDAPLDRPRNWSALVNESLEGPALDAVHASVARGRPFGETQWTAKLARRLGLQSTLNPRGRPPKPRKS